LCFFINDFSPEKYDHDAVILPIEEYEKMAQIIELVEHLEIAQLIQERQKEAGEIPFDDVLKQNSIRRDEL